MEYRETRIKAFDAEKRAQMLHMEANRLIEFAETQFSTQGTKDNETGQRSLQPIKVQRIVPNGENVDIEELFYTNVKRNVQASQYLEDSVFESVQHTATKPTLTNETTTRSTPKKTKRRKKKKRHRTKSKSSSVETSSWHEVALTPRRRPSLGEFQNTFDRWHEVPSKRQPSLEDFQDAFDQFYSDDDFSSVKEIVLRDKRRQPQIREPLSQSPMQDMESVFSAETDRFVSAREGVSDPSMDKMIVSASIPKQKVKLRKVEYDKSDQYITPYEGVMFNQGSSYKEDKETWTKSLAGLSSPNSTPDSGSWKILVQNPFGKKKKSKSGKQKKAKPKEDAVDRSSTSSNISAESSSKEHKTKPTSSADNKKDLSSPGKDSKKSKKVSKMKKDKKSKYPSYEGEPSVTVTLSATSSLGLSPSSASSKERVAKKKMTSPADGKPGWMSVLRTPPKTPTPPVKIPSTTPQPVPVSTQQKSPSAHLATSNLGLSPSSKSSKERAAEKKMTSVADGKPGWMSVLRTPPKTPTPPVKIPSTTPQPVPVTTQQKSPSAHLATSNLGLSPSSKSSKERAAEKKMTSVADGKPGWMSVLRTPPKTPTPPVKIPSTTPQPVATQQKSPSARLATSNLGLSPSSTSSKERAAEKKLTSLAETKPGWMSILRTPPKTPTPPVKIPSTTPQPVATQQKSPSARLATEAGKLMEAVQVKGKDKPIESQMKMVPPQTVTLDTKPKPMLPELGSKQCDAPIGSEKPLKQKSSEDPSLSKPSSKGRTSDHKIPQIKSHGHDVIENKRPDMPHTEWNRLPDTGVLCKESRGKDRKPENPIQLAPSENLQTLPHKRLFEKRPPALKIPDSKKNITDASSRTTEPSKEQQKASDKNPQQKELAKIPEGTPKPAIGPKEPEKLKVIKTEMKQPVKLPEKIVESTKPPKQEPSTKSSGWMSGWLTKSSSDPAATPKQPSSMDKKDTKIEVGKDNKAKEKPSGSGLFKKHPKETKLGEKLDIICLKPASLEKPKPADLFSKSPSSKAVIKTETKEQQKIVPQKTSVELTAKNKPETTENKSTMVTKVAEDIKKPDEKKRSVSPFRKIPSSREPPQAVKETKVVDKPKGSWYGKAWPWSNDKNVADTKDIPKNVEKEHKIPNDFGKFKIDKSKEAEKVSRPSGEPKTSEISSGKYETVSYELALTMVPGQPPRITPIRPPTVTTFTGCISTNRFDENMGGNKKMAPDAVYVNDCKIWSRKD